VFDRVEVDVIEMPGKIGLVAQGIFPISSVPNPALAFAGAADRDLLASGQATREGAFNQAPTLGEISIVLGQGPNHVRVIRQDHSGIDRKGMPCPDTAKCRPQQTDILGQQHEPKVGQISREEKAAAEEKVAPIIWHRRRLYRRDPMGFGTLNPSYANYAYYLAAWDSRPAYLAR
jgi:hypothetical protein